MEALYFWPERPALSILVLWVLSVVFLYLARVPMHRLLRSTGTLVGGALRLADKWLRRAGGELSRRNREVLLESGRANAERKLERELTRLDSAYTKELARYPELHRRLDHDIAKIDADYQECAKAPPEVPAYGEAVRAMAGIQKAPDRMVEKVLDEIRKTVATDGKKALQEYREATAKRHKILAAMAPTWREVRAAAAQTLTAVNAVLQSTRKIDTFTDQYEKIRKQEDAAVRALSASSLNLFVVSAIVVLIAAGGAFINFHLIALPMSELVPSGSRLLGMPVSTVAALVIVLMEVAAGIFVMEALGVTELFPKIGQLSPGRRRVILTVGLAGLLLLAAIESSLAILRESIVEAEVQLKQSLAGSRVGEAVAQPATSSIPVIGQAVLGFILPWILAMIAVPLEMLIESGRHVGGRLAVGLLIGFGFVLRLIGHGMRYLAAGAGHLYDLYIIIPLQLERVVRRRMDLPSSAEGGGMRLRNPADRTGEYRARRG